MKNIYRWLLALALLPTLGSVHAASPVVSQAGGACLVANGNTASLGACNGQTTQGFTFSNAGTVISGGQCLEVGIAIGGGGIGAPVRLAPCSNGGKQVWKRDGDFLVSVGQSLCLRALPGTKSVALDTCAYNADRKWNVAGLPGNWPSVSTSDKPKPTAAVAGASLNSAQLAATVNWIYAETRLDNLPFCWKKDGYDRGSGIAPSECPAGKVNQAGLCYDPPRNGYGCTAMTCSESCPSGYSSSGALTCTYTGGPKTYSKKPHAIPWSGKCQKSRFKYGGLCYDKEDDGARCRSGYAMQVAGICSFQGKWDTTRGTYTRAAGTVPGGCLSNRVKEVGMCYVQPRDGYTCTVTICTQKCASGTLDCGAGCARDVGTCSASITDMVVSPALMLASLATGGTAGAAANSVKAAVQNAQKAADLGTAAADLALILRDSINDYMNAAEGDLASIATPEVEAQVAAKYGKGSANYRLIARQYALLQILAAVSDMILQLEILAVSMIDATGVVSTINAFAKPLCEKHKPIP